MIRNFRIIKKKIDNKWRFGVCEVYYNDEDNNKPHLRSDFIDGLFDSEKELQKHFETILEDIKECMRTKSTIIDLEEDPKHKVWSDKPISSESNERSDLVI